MVVGAPEPTGRASSGSHGAGTGAGRQVILAATAFVICVALVIVLFGWGGGSRTAASGPRAPRSSGGNPEHLPSLPANRPAPAFQLPRLGGGPPVSSKDFSGTPLVVNFFASWCPNCLDEMRTFATEADAVRGRVAFVGVDLNDPDQQAARSVIARAGVRYPVGVDESAGTAVSYWVVALPTTVFIDRHGRLLGEAFGAQSPHQLRAWIDRLQAAA